MAPRKSLERFIKFRDTAVLFFNLGEKAGSAHPGTRLREKRIPSFEVDAGHLPVEKRLKDRQMA